MSRHCLVTLLVLFWPSQSCRAAILSSLDGGSLPAENGTAPVPLNSLLITIARSPQVPDKPDNATAAADQRSKFGPFGQIFELETRGPFFRKGIMVLDTDPLTPRDFERAKQLKNELSPEGFDDPINQEAYFQGDIVIPVSDFVALDDNNANVETRLWPGGRIYYTMSRSFTSREKSVIAAAVQEFEKRTCLRVIPLPPGFTNSDHVHVIKDAGCFSSVGLQGGRQELSLGEGCVFKGIVMHEFMHAAGFWHEQSRPDRDRFVRVHYDNIKPLMRFNFRKYEWGKVPNLGLSYDIGSIMHYGPYAFARDKSRPTLTAVVANSGSGRMGQREGFSGLDVQKLNRLYESECDSTTTVTTTTPPPPPTKPERCVDQDDHCEFWAGRGECSRNPDYMHVNCKLSCKKCGGEFGCSLANSNYFGFM